MIKIKEKNNTKALKEKIENIILIIVASFCIGFMAGNFQTIIDYKVVDVSKDTVTMQIFGRNYIYEYNK